MSVKEIESTKYSLEDLVSVVAHEIKNPIALIKANIDYLSAFDKQLNSVGEKNFKVINNQLNKLVELTYEYTSLVKINNERKINIYLHDLLHNIYSDYKESYGEIQFEYLCQEEDRGVEVKGNFMLLDIAIRNLVKNSVEALQSEGGIIKIKLIKASEICKIIVQDNGGGLSNIDINTAKQKFQTTKENGTGLGLFITDYIIKGHNGYFELKTDKGGCTATVLL